jgi:hypothetical protein
MLISGACSRTSDSPFPIENLAMGRLRTVSKPQQRGAGLRATGALVCLLLVLVGCTSDDTYLPALEADPMASYEADGLELSDSWEYAYRTRLGGGVPHQPEVARTYRIEDQSQARQLLEDAVAFAVSEGWEMTQPLTNRPDFYSGTKELGPGTGELGVWLGAEDPLHDPDGPRRLKILLEYDPAIE